MIRADRFGGRPVDTLDALTGIGSLLLGAVMITTFLLLLGSYRAKTKSAAYIDNTPSDGRSLFGGHRESVGGGQPRQ